MSLESEESAISREIADLSEKIRPLVERRTALVNELRAVRARAFVSANNIKLADIELSSGEGKPWFGVIWDFTTWLKLNSTKNYAEWNNVVYRTSDLVAGRMPEMPATIHDL